MIRSLELDWVRVPAVVVDPVRKGAAAPRFARVCPYCSLGRSSEANRVLLAPMPQIQHFWGSAALHTPLTVLMRIFTPPTPSASI